MNNVLYLTSNTLYEEQMNIMLYQYETKNYIIIDNRWFNDAKMNGVKMILVAIRMNDKR